MRLRLRLAAAALLALVPAGSGSAQPPSPFGLWLTEDRNAVIAIEPCGGSLCGRIVGLPLDSPNDPIPVDHMGRSQCGLTIIGNGAQDGDTWMARIMDPRDGATYHATIRPDMGRLRVRGYVGIPLLGRTQVWSPFAGRVPADCRLPPRAPG